MSSYAALTASRARHLENALKLLDQSKVARHVAYPIDLFLRKYFYAHKKQVKREDRRFISEHLYELVRWRGLLDLVGGAPYVWHHRMKTFFLSQGWKDQRLAARKISAAARVGFPEELFAKIAESFEQNAFSGSDAILNEKPVYFLRVNVLRASRQQVFETLLSKEIPCELCKHSEIGIVLHDGAAKSKLLQLPERVQGLFEFQDESSQLMALEVDCRPGDKVLDFCAGSGGKSLVFGAKLRGEGGLFLHDIRDTVLHKARGRLRRGGVKNYQILPPSHPFLPKLIGKCDWVVVDVPNSAYERTK
eukprot:g12049.t1